MSRDDFPTEDSHRRFVQDVESGSSDEKISGFDIIEGILPDRQRAEGPWTSPAP